MNTKTIKLSLTTLALALSMTGFSSQAVFATENVLNETKVEQLVKFEAIADSPYKIAQSMIEDYKTRGNENETKFLIDATTKSALQSFKTNTEAYDMLDKLNVALVELSGEMYSIHYGLCINLGSGGADSLDDKTVTLWLTPEKFEQDKIEEMKNSAKAVADMAREYSTDIKEQLKFVNSYLVDNVEYDYYSVQHKEEVEIAPWSAYGALVNHKAVCAGYSNAMTLICDELGIPVIEVVGDNHEWNKVYVDGTWLNIDATFNDPTWNGEPTKQDIEKAKLKYFLVDDSKLTGQGKPVNNYIDAVNAKYENLENRLDTNGRLVDTNAETPENSTENTANTVNTVNSSLAN